MTLDEFTAAIRHRLQKISKPPWYTLEQPFVRGENAGMSIQAGSQDPHAARPVCDCEMTYEWIDGEPDGRIEDRNNADFIKHAPRDLSDALEIIAVLHDELWRLGDTFTAETRIRDILKGTR